MKSAEYFITNTQPISSYPDPGSNRDGCYSSTDSAIWATVSLNCGAKVSHFSDTHKFWKTFSLTFFLTI